MNNNTNKTVKMILLKCILIGCKVTKIFLKRIFTDDICLH